MSNKEMRRLIKTITDQGGEVGMTSSGHWRVYNPQTHRSIRLPATPSDVRSLRNAATRLRKIGLLKQTAR